MHCIYVYIRECYLRFYLQYFWYLPLWSTSLLPSIRSVSPSLKYFAFTFNTFCISLFEVLRFYLQYVLYLPLWSTSLLPSIRSVSPSLKYFAFTFNTFCISLFEVLRFYLQYFLYLPLWNTSLLPSTRSVSPSLKYFASLFQRVLENFLCVSRNPTQIWLMYSITTWVRNAWTWHSFFNCTRGTIYKSTVIIL